MATFFFSLQKSNIKVDLLAAQRDVLFAVVDGDV